MVNPVGSMLERNSAYGAILNNCIGIPSISTIRSKVFKDFPGQLSCFALDPGSFGIRHTLARRIHWAPRAVPARFETRKARCSCL
jgi:hypothetical protein